MNKENYTLYDIDKETIADLGKQFAYLRATSEVSAEEVLSNLELEGFDLRMVEAGGGCSWPKMSAMAKAYGKRLRLVIY